MRPLSGLTLVMSLTCGLTNLQGLLSKHRPDLITNTLDRKRRNAEKTVFTGIMHTGNLPNMLKNPSFEEAFPTKRAHNPWAQNDRSLQTRNCSMAFGGHCSLLVSNRMESSCGAAQIVRGMKPGKAYTLSAKIRTLNNVPNILWNSVKATLSFTFTDNPKPKEYVLQAEADKEEFGEDEKTKCERSGKGQKQRADLKPDTSEDITYTISYRGFVRAEDGWIRLNGDMNTPMREFKDEVRFLVRALPAEVDFLLDEVSLVEIPEEPDWTETALKESARHRKSDFVMKFVLPSGVEPKDIDVEVSLKNHLFAFGSKIEDDCMSSPTAQKYQDFVYSVFNWVTVGNYKWRFDEGTPVGGPFDLFDTQNGERALAQTMSPHHTFQELPIRKKEVQREAPRCVSPALKVRAHSILWGVSKNVPEWVQAVPASDLTRVVTDHVIYMVNITKGLVEQWDVQNEYVHGHFFEEKLQDPYFTMDLFKLVRSLDPNVKLYLNDFLAVTTGAQIEDIFDIVRRFKEYGAPIDGIGIQGHTREYVKPDPLMIWKRLNRLGTIDGLEVMITEFDIGHNDDVIRADWLEDAMRAFFAHPVLKGVVLWGFWNLRQRYENKYLIYGDGFKMVETGTRFVCLVKKEWFTQHAFNLADHPSMEVPLNGYKGDYQVVIRNKGVPVQQQTFVMHNDSLIKVYVTKKGESITLPTKPDHISECISHRDPKSLGKVSSSDTKSSGKRCTTRKQSAKGGHASVTCQQNEILTGCSGSYESYQKTKKEIAQARRGERITFVGGKPTCTASMRDPYPTDKVTAVAQCCAFSSLSCNYRQAGPSLLMQDAMAETTCPAGFSALGCAVYTDLSVVNGVVFRNSQPNSCVGRNGPSLWDTSKSGVMTSAPCCKRKGYMKCKVRTSDTEKKTATVFCPKELPFMTSCSAGGLAYSAEKKGTACVVEGFQCKAIITCCTLKTPKYKFKFNW